jgi:hypothetical protein
MPSIAGTSPEGALRFNFRTLVSAAVPSPAAATSTRDALTARAMAGAGLAAILGLPLLLLSSLALGAPLAIPAAIASGYLAISHALASNRPRRAALISGFVLAALVGWLILYLAQGEDSLSRTGLTAALMTPLFAAAPALARSVLGRRGDEGDAASAARAAALQRVACLDELAPTEAVVIADREGAVLAATQAAKKRLRLLPDTFEQPVASAFDPAGMPDVADALRRCRMRGAPVEMVLEDAGEGETATWVASPFEDGAVSLRLQATAMRVAAKAADDRRRPAAEASMSRACDLGEAVAFALRRARPRAARMGIGIAVACDDALLAACDRQVGRRVAHLAIESALAASGAGGAIRVDARRLKGIVLLRVMSERADDAVDDDDASELATLRAVVDDAGGTLIVERNAGRATLSVRLALADVATTMERMERRAEAG